MIWNDYLHKREISPHTTSLMELNNLRALIRRDLADASILALSTDRRFATAYNAALQSATIAVVCSGFRVAARAGHHAVTFEAAALALGKSAIPLTDYFDTCRRKRNSIDYQSTSVATETETAELLRNVEEFHTIVERWVSQYHPAWKA